MEIGVAIRKYYIQLLSILSAIAFIGWYLIPSTSISKILKLGYMYRDALILESYFFFNLT